MSNPSKSLARKLAPFVVLLGIAGIAGGTWAVYAHTKDKQRTAREDAFADLSVCLLGERVVSGDDTINGLTATQARVAHATNPERGPIDGTPWPQRCSAPARTMMEAVRQSTLLEESSKTDLLKVLDELAKELDAERSQDTYLARAVLAVWRSAERAGVYVGPASSAAPPPMPTPLEGSPDLPFSGLFSVPGGPQWAFLTDRKDRPNALSVCHLTDDKLLCHEFESTGRITTGCTWENPALIPIFEDRIPKVFQDGKLVPVDIDAIDGGQCHVDEAGTFYALTRTSDERRLVVKPLGQKAVGKPLAKVLDLGDKEAITWFLVGKTLIVDVGDHLLGVALDASGPVKGKPVTLGPSPRTAYEFLRAGKAWYLVGRATPPTLTPLDPSKGFGSPLSPTQPFVGGGNPSGWLFTQKSVCSSTKCQSWIGEDEAAAFTAGVGRLPGRDMAGSRLVTAWAAKDGNGVLMNVRDLASEGSRGDLILISPRSDPKDNPIAVFGDDRGALVLAEVEKRVVGARVLPDGRATQLVVEWR